MKLRKTLLAASVSSLLAISANAYAAGGTLKIQVTDSNGQPVAGATVSVKSPDTLTSRTATTDENGFLRIAALDPARNYSISIEEDGYLSLTKENVIVVSDKVFELDYVLATSEQDYEKIAVTGSRTATYIDTTSSTVGMDITLDLTESLPTGRDYQSYLQLAPGTKPSASGNPSSKSGVNYSDIGGTIGSSTDNVYYLDGIDTTDGNSGGFGSNINSEIIQEQRVLTGGIPAKYAGGTGLVSIVNTKSGGNEFSGSINYYLQNDSLVGDNDHTEGAQFSTYDTAVTLGGPIIQDELWFFASYQKKNRQDDLFTEDGVFARSVEEDSDLGFFKLTWQATDRDMLEVSWFNDPREVSGSSDPNVLNNRDSARKYGGDNYKIEYTHSWDDLILSLKASKHEKESSVNAAYADTRNDVAYLNYTATQEETDKGGVGINEEEFRNREQYNADLTYYYDTSYGLHTIEAGIGYVKNTLEQDSTYTGDGQYTSIGANSSGATLANYTSGANWQGTIDLSEGDYARIIENMEGSSDYAYYQGLLDTDGSGVISSDELAGLVFNSTAGNPTGDVNVYRIIMTQTNPVEMKTEGQTAYIQDTLTFDQLSVTAGVRAEKWEHFGSNGSKVANFDWEFAPRLSLSYDLFGDGASKVFGFYGRYYDPVRTNMTDFAGNVTGPVREEQIYAGDRWLTFRTRGGESGQDAFFAPTTKTPYTDEYMIGYATALNDEYAVEVTYTERKTRDILEDYDLGVYTQDLAGTSLELPLSYFGYSEIPESNYVIATLEGGERDYKGYEISFRRNRIDNWQAYASLTYNDAAGNTNSDSNADLQGDLVWMDPRAPGMYGDQPGNIEYLFKAYGTYYFDNGIEVGAVYNWNSGFTYSATSLLYGRHVPLRVDTPYDFGGYSDRWAQEGVVGSQESDSYGTLDIRVKYTYDFDYAKAEFFLDIFNVLDDQAGIQQMDVVAGDLGYAYGEDIDWVEPRRFYLGARLTF